MLHNVEILDCTLRDGSYPINYAFSLEDNENIVNALESSGVRWIEVGGHGMGLGASTCQYGLSAYDDLQHVHRSLSSAKLAKIGLFAIPGIASESLFKESLSTDIGFIRIGVDVDKSERAIRFIELAKENNKVVFLNLMKTYGLPVSTLTEILENLGKMQIDVISLVDSAGTMLPSEVQKYITSMKQGTDSAIGFHGHNNLQLAIMNSVAAIQAGATFVDTTLRGIGRSSGNAQIEVLLVVLNRMGIKIDIDPFSLADFSDVFFNEDMPDYGIDSVELACGAFGFHSSFLPKLVEISKKHNLDLLRLIPRITKIDQINFNEQAILDEVQNYSNKPQSSSYPTLISKNTKSNNTLDDYLAELIRLGQKRQKNTCLTVSSGKVEEIRFGEITSHEDLIIGNIEVSETYLESENLLKQNFAKITYIGFEQILEETVLASNLIKESGYFVYNEKKIVDLFIANLVDTYRPRNDYLFTLVRGNTRTLASKDRKQIQYKGSKLNIAIVLDPVHMVDTFDSLLSEFDRVLLVESFTIPIEFLIDNHQSGLIFRLNHRSFFDIHIRHQVQILQDITFDQKPSCVAGVEVVSHGLIGKSGTVVVDNVCSPRRIIGLADGRGGIRKFPSNDTELKNISLLSEFIVQDILLNSREID